MMKNFLVKELMLPLICIMGPSEDIQPIQRVVQLIQCEIQQHNAHLAHIKKHIQCMPLTEQPGYNVIYPTPIEYSDD